MANVIEEDVNILPNQLLDAHYEECIHHAQFNGVNATRLPPSYALANKFVQLIQVATDEQREKLVAALVEGITRKELTIGQLEAYVLKPEETQAPHATTKAAVFQEAAQGQVQMHKEITKILKQTLTIWAPEAAAAKKPEISPKVG